MRTIVKRGDGTYDLQKANESPPPTSHDAETRWSSFGHKAVLQDMLLEQQYGLCAYSELRADQEGLGYHIEHVRPKSQFPQETFFFGNLISSALRDQDLRARPASEVFGGHAKRDAYEENRFVSCLDPDCPRFFAYLSTGHVVPALALDPQDRGKADYTIGLLNLNSPFLVTLRRQWWEDLDSLYQKHIDDDMSIYHLAAVDLLPANDRLSWFFSVTRQFFAGTAEQVLADEAPELL
jgi:uncharacterized protein (TIGR02646 family)